MARSPASSPRRPVATSGDVVRVYSLAPVRGRWWIVTQDAQRRPRARRSEKHLEQAWGRPSPSGVMDQPEPMTMGARVVFPMLRGGVHFLVPSPRPSLITLDGGARRIR